MNKIYRDSILYIFRKVELFSPIKKKQQKNYKNIKLNGSMYTCGFIQHIRSSIIFFRTIACMMGKLKANKRSFPKPHIEENIQVRPSLYVNRERIMDAMYYTVAVLIFH